MRAAGGYLAWLAVVVGMLAGVVVRDGVHCAGGMTPMSIEHAANSRMPAGTPGAFTAGHSALSRISTGCSWNEELWYILGCQVRCRAPMTSATIETVAVIVRRVDQRRAQW